MDEEHYQQRGQKYDMIYLDQILRVYEIDYYGMYSHPEFPLLPPSALP